MIKVSGVSSTQHPGKENLDITMFSWLFEGENNNSGFDMKITGFQQSYLNKYDPYLIQRENKESSTKALRKKTRKERAMQEAEIREKILDKFIDTLNKLLNKKFKNIQGPRQIIELNNGRQITLPESKVPTRYKIEIDKKQKRRDPSNIIIKSNIKDDPETLIRFTYEEKQELNEVLDPKNLNFLPKDIQRKIREENQKVTKDYLKKISPEVR
ncbi:MAG: hypothetical protein HRT47_10960 [Candidatus Caenarcaniphilales bacterium]|nr:hypothetical protein [Candidatus Caenarcaniphilales bacterium]